MANYYLFQDEESGEVFYVQSTSLRVAIREAHETFVSPRFLQEDDGFTAEMNGYDVY